MDLACLIQEPQTNKNSYLYFLSFLRFSDQNTAQILNLFLLKINFYFLFRVVH